MKAFLDAIRPLFWRPVARRAGDRLALLGMRPVTVRKVAPTSSKPTHDTMREIAQIAATRRTDGAEWSETQPWCHQ